MGVKTEHADYVSMKSEWQKCIDFMESEKAVHDAGEDYLPSLSEQDATEYEKYKTSAPVAMLAKKSNKTMVGMVMRKPSYIAEVENVEDLLEYIDSEGNNFETYQSEVLRRFNATGRVGTLVDVPMTNEGITVAEAEAMGVRPRFVKYNEMDIINWRTERINNMDQLVFVVLREEIDELEDEFNWTVVYQYRVLDIYDGMYRQRVFNDAEQVVSEIYPKMQGEPLSLIPFVIHGGVKVQQPPLNEVVDLNRHHYVLSADEAWGLKMAATPTPYVIGVDPDDENFPNHVGAGCVIGIADTDAKTGFREFTGAGMGAVATKLEKFENLMAQLSVQFATDSASTNSATESAINQGNSTASLAGQVQVLSGEFTTALRIMGAWASRVADGIVVQMNTDFLPTGMSAQDVQARLNLYLQGTITYDTLYKNLAKGEITDPNKDSQSELDEIEDSIPPGLE